MAGVFTSDKRVVRDGVLIAFKGQTMTEQEAEALGLTKKESAKGTEPPKRGKKEAAAEAKELGITVPRNATIAKIDELIAAKRAELEAANQTDPENPSDPENPADPENPSDGQTDPEDEDDTGNGDGQTDPENPADGKDEAEDQTKEDGKDE